MCIQEKQTVDECLSKWGKDSNTIDLQNKTTLWLTGMKSNADKAIYLRLLSNFNYYSREKIYEIFIYLHQVLLTKQKMDETIFVPIISPEGGRFNHSYEMVGCYRDANRISKNLCPIELDQVIAQYPLDTVIKNVVFLDDMLGTGKTVKDAFLFMFRHYNKLFVNKNIYLTVIEATYEGTERIRELKTEIGLEIEILKWNFHRKAFTPEYIFNSSESDSAKITVSDYERLISRGRFILGFEQSEALMSFFYDTPNNTLSSFWYENLEIGWSPLFPRKRDQPDPRWVRDLKNQKKIQSNLKYELAKVQGRGQIK